MEPGEVDPSARTWAGRVAYSPDGGGYAYRPGQMLVRTTDADRAIARFPAWLRRGAQRREAAGFELLGCEIDPAIATARLRAEEVKAQPNHVLFAGCGGGCACPPHPAAGCGGASGTPMYGTPMYGTPMYGTPMYGTPMYGTPMYGTPMYGTPMYGTGTYAATGRRRSSARPCDDPGASPATTAAAGHAPVVAIIDTGLAVGALRPPALSATALPAPDGTPSDDGVPDFDADLFLDPAAGHSTFIAGLVERIAPGCTVTVTRVLSNLGDGDEYTIAAAVAGLAGQADLLNLSLGGYAADRMEALAAAVALVQTTPAPAAAGNDAAANGAVVIASAGNDATCRAPFPACLPGVVSVGAIGPAGPAPFTNYGPWVRACAPGVDLVSTFFTEFDGAETGTGPDPDRFRSWATWSGTSFSAPVVAGALAREMQRSGCLPAEAVARIVDGPGLGRIPGLGTVVNVL